MHPGEHFPTPSQPSTQKERRHRRFNLQFPVCLSFPSGGQVCELAVISQNVSLGGLLLKSGTLVPPLTQVKLTMDVKGPWSHRMVRLVAKGRVVRVEPLGPDSGFAIAVECERAITEMKGHLPAAS